MGDAINALIVDVCHFFFYSAVVLGPPNLTLISAETQVSNASS